MSLPVVTELRALLRSDSDVPAKVIRESRRQAQMLCSGIVACADCGAEKKRLECHHIDENPLNNVPIWGTIYMSAQSESVPTATEKGQK